MSNTKAEIFKQYLNILEHANDFVFWDFIANVKAVKVHQVILASVIMQKKKIMSNLKESSQGEYIVDHIEYQIFEHELQFKCAGKLYVNLDSVSVELFQPTCYMELQI